MEQKSFVLYIIFGLLSTLVNIFTFGLGVKTGCSTFYANALAWFVTILFVYITNRQWVFESKVHTVKGIFYEFTIFILCRITTGLIDQIIVVAGTGIICNMLIADESLFFWQLAVKMFSNIFVILCNYLFSKAVVFKKQL